MTSAPPAAQPGVILVAPGEVFAGKYVVEREIGAGGMGVVVAARHKQLGQTVAIKLLNVPSEVRPEAVKRFLVEAQAAARLRSEHVARVMDADVDDRGRHYIVMEYLQGADLGGLLEKTGPLPITDAVGYVMQACEGIAEAHANGIIHRDLKPENLFVTRRIDGSPLVKVLDFGISKMLSDDLRPQHSVTPSGALMGSPLYMSPEQLRVGSVVDARSDVWGLGVILYELVTNRIPFAGAELPQLIAAVLAGAPAPVESLRADVPPALAAVISRALAKAPEGRFANVGELALALAPWAPPWASDCAARAARTLGLASGVEVIASSPISVPPPPAPPRGRRRGALVAAGAAAAIVVAAFVLLRGGSSPPPPLPSPAPPASVVSVPAAPPVGAPIVEAVAAPAPTPPPRAAKPKARRPVFHGDPLEGRK
jgi:serine/threonine-protein kinase